MSHAQRQTISGKLEKTLKIFRRKQTKKYFSYTSLGDVYQYQTEMVQPTYPPHQLNCLIKWGIKNLKKRLKAA